MQLTAGTRMGPYEIVSPLGAGGMGEVYRARDTRLGRLVALKIANEQFTERFTQEARAVAALNHPNIVALYDVGENYLVTELVDGESLRGRELSARRAVDIAAQVASGLAAAHAAGIAHRDLKPENVMVTRDGNAKILDFGLARQYAGPIAGDATKTLPGTVAGTVGYMSPEQVRGQEADHRSDIFSFGAMLYELLSGKRAFQADTSAEVMTAILKEDPPELAYTVPAVLREIVGHCLEKDPAARFQSAKDLSFALRSSFTQSVASGTVPTIPAKRPRRWLAVAGMGAAVVAAFAVGWFAKRGGSEGLAGYRYTPIASEAVPELDPAWSADGKSLAYVALSGEHLQLFIRRLDSPVADQITHEDADVSAPIWSQRGDRIYYLKSARDELQSIAALGGAPQKALDGVHFAAIAPDGVSVAAVLHTGHLAFGKLGSTEFAEYRQPPFDGNYTAFALKFSPDGRKLAVLFTRIYTTQGEIWVLPFPLGKGAPRKLFAGERSVATFSGLDWMPDSRRLVVTLSRSGEADQLYLGDSESGKLRQLTAGMEFASRPAVSPDGLRIAYAQTNPDQKIVEFSLENGAMRPVLITARMNSWAAWMPNGREFVYTSNANGPFDIWIRNVEDNRARPLVTSAHDSFPEGRLTEIAVAPDGDRIAFTAWSNEHTIWQLRSSGGKTVRVDMDNPDTHSPSWSPDGNWIAYSRALPKSQLMKAPAGGGAPVVLATEGSRFGPSLVAWSPAGDRILWGGSLYSPDGALVKKLVQRQHRGMAFSPDGKTLYGYYVDLKEGRWFFDAMDVESGTTREIGSVLLERTEMLRGMKLHPDGKRFLASVEKANPDIVMLEGF